MEAKQNPHLKKVLKSYQLAAPNTMSGPGPGPSYINSKGDNGFHRNSLDSVISAAKICVTLTDPSVNLNSKFVGRKTGNSFTSPKLVRSASQGGNSGQLPSDTYLIRNGVTIKRENMETNNGEIKDTAHTPSDTHAIVKKENTSVILKRENSNPVTGDQVPVSVRMLPLPPILTESDSSGTMIRQTLLEGEFLSCFSVGGEDRICFPHVISVLRHALGEDFLLPQINQVCDELQIFCSLCSSVQMKVLKKNNLLPVGAASCGLIRKTDAERLVNSMLHQNPPKSAIAINMETTSAKRVAGKFQLGKISGQSASHFRIFHECFGTSEGVLIPHLYEKSEARCIECIDCHGLMSPSQFVRHTHHRQENRTCHWGFDSANWRYYILLSEDQDNLDQKKVALEDFKAKFQNHKRKETPPSPKEKKDDPQVVIKKVRYSDCHSSLFLSKSPTEVQESLFLLPSKKRLTFAATQSVSNTKNAEKNGVGLVEKDLDFVKKFVSDRMDRSGADIVNGFIDSLINKISTLQTNCLCPTHGKVLDESAVPKAAIQCQIQPETPVKVNSVEMEIGSLKKQLLRRHEQLEENIN